MPGNADVTIEQSIAITDPGETDRDQQPGRTDWLCMLATRPHGFFRF